MMRQLLGLALVTGLLVALPARAEDKKKPEAVDEKAVAEAMMKAAMPGEHHKKLEPLVGKWDADVKMWMDPSKPPSESKMTAETKWVMGNRYLRMAVKGNFGGMEFEGVGVSGYDNLRQQYVGAWIDNMATGIMRSAGTYDDATKTFTYFSEEIDPLTKEKVKGKDVIKIIDADHYTDTMYKLAGGQEIKMMEITSTRAK
jgi:hypothetical protein